MSPSRRPWGWPASPSCIFISLFPQKINTVLKLVLSYYYRAATKHTGHNNRAYSQRKGERSEVNSRGGSTLKYLGFAPKNRRFGQKCKNHRFTNSPYMTVYDFQSEGKNHISPFLVPKVSTLATML